MIIKTQNFTIKFLAILLTIMLYIGLFPIMVHAATTVQDGLEVTLVTDKTTYNQDEEITAKITLKNTNDYAIDNISIKSLIPNGYKLADESKDIKEISSLEAGETINISITFKCVKSINETIIAPNTGADYGMLFWFILMISNIVLVVFVFKNKTLKKIIIMSLCCAIILSMFSGIAMAAQEETVNSKTIEISTNAVIDEKNIEIKAIISYQIPKKEEIITYNIIFDSNGGSEVISQTIPIGELVTEPDEPKKEGYTFIGWKDLNDDMFQFNEPINENLVLTAEWVETVNVDQEKLDVLDDVYSEGDISETINSEPLTNIDVSYRLNGIGKVSITEVISDPMNNTAGLLGTPVEINACGGDVETATITFQYDPEQLGDADENDLAIVWYDEENDIMILLEDSVVNADNNTVSVTTTHFSKYGVVLRQLWDEAWNLQLPAIRTNETPYYNVVLAMDCSGSMGYDKMQKSIQAAQNLVDILTNNDCISVLAFDSSVDVIVDKMTLTSISESGELLDNREMIKNALSTLYGGGGGTNIERVLEEVGLYKNEDPQYQQLVILLSDGQSYVSEESIQNLKTNGQKVITVGIGSDVDQSLMQQIADGTEGSYLYCEDASDLADAFIDLQNIYIGSTVDRDNDGLPDLVETTGMRDQYGEIWKTDPNVADTDGDGYTDSEEMGQYNALVAHPYFKRESRPDLYTVMNDESYLLMPESMMYVFEQGNNKLKLVVYITDARYRMVPDIITPIEEDGILKEYIYSAPKNLKVELEQIPSNFTLEEINTVEEDKYGYATTYKTIAVLSYTSTTELDTVTWKVTADNCSEWSGYFDAGIKANYIKKKQPVKQNKVEPNNDLLEKAELNMATQAYDLVNTLSNNSKNKKSTYDTWVENLRKEMNINTQQSNIKGESIPSEIYEAFASAVLSALEDSVIEEYETEQSKLASQIYNQIKHGLVSDSKTVIINNKQYRVSYQIMALSWSDSGIGVAWQTVKVGNDTVILYWTNANSESGYKALANYCAALAQLNTDMWKEFLAYYVSDACGIAGIKDADDIKDNVREILDSTEKTIKALDGDKEAANDLLEDIGEKAKEKLESEFGFWASNKFKKFVKENVPNGENIVKAAEYYVKAEEKFVDFKVTWYAYLRGECDIEKVNRAYANFESAYKTLEEKMNKL